MPRLPAGDLRQASSPDAQVAREVADLVLPDALDCRGKVLVMLRGHGRNYRVERRQRMGQILLGDRQPALLPQGAKEGRLHLVKDRAAGQWIELLQRLRLLGRLEAINRGQQKLVRARGELL